MDRVSERVRVLTDTVMANSQTDRQIDTCVDGVFDG